MFLRCFHVEAYARTLFLFYYWIIFHCIYTSQFVYLLICLVSGFFCVWAAVINAAMNTGIQILVWISVFNSYAFLPRSGFAGSHSVWFYKEPPWCFPKQLHHFTFSPAIHKGSSCSTFYQYFFVFDNSYPNGYGLPWWPHGKESTYNVGDLGLIPGLGWSPRGGHGNPLKYSCLENPHKQRNLVDYSPWGYRESDLTEWLRHPNGYEVVSHCGFDLHFNN